MNSGIRCPQCRNGITPGTVTCPFCGHSMQDFVVVADEPRTWQETCYLIASIFMVLQGAMFIAAGLGAGVTDFAFPPAVYIGVAVIVIGIGLLRDQIWAQWIARIAGIAALLQYGSMALRYGLSVGTLPNAIPLCLFGVGWFLYWAFLEYLIWSVSD